MEFTALKGTEKQVNWAKAIRKDRLIVWQGADPDGFEAVESMLSQQGLASWWITGRDKSLKEVCSQLQGGAPPKASSAAASKKAVPSVFKVTTMERVYQADDGELWETVETSAGFRRSGPARDMVTGEVVLDATLPF
jgi:hypothetical protein